MASPIAFVEMVSSAIACSRDPGGAFCTARWMSFAASE
ncbi:hypothetical protein J2Z69_000866 [Paenibacillus shirakamiensis]|uniref:Uncharacterized protein n=1 Tax=Paenibacillus shirakamiensis TaxID=1265935 RepID=A0ABS4JDP2_9BACL|nr:hypothetical protein [Paenibacillus shirakamiensis]